MLLYRFNNVWQIFWNYFKKVIIKPLTPGIFYIYVPHPFHWPKNEEKLFLVPKLSGPLLARLPLKRVFDFPSWSHLVTHSRALTTRVIESDIHHFAADMKEFSGECFDFASAFCLGGLVLKPEQKEAVSRSREDFPSCGLNTKMNFQKIC